MNIFTSSHLNKHIESEKIKDTERPVNKTETAIDSEKNDSTMKSEKELKSTDICSVNEYNDYRQALQTYEQLLMKETECKNMLEKAEQQHTVYVAKWKESIEKAEYEWEKQKNNDQKCAHAAREKLKNDAEAEKNDRINKVNEIEKNASQKMEFLLKKLEGIEKEERILRQKLQDANSYNVNINGFDASVKKIIDLAVQKKFLSADQIRLVHVPEPQFCQEWAKTPNELGALEERILQTQFIKNILGQTVSDKTYKNFTSFLGSVLGIAVFVFSLIYKSSELLLARAFMLFGSFCFTALIESVIFFCIAMVVKKQKKVRFTDSKTGLIACIIAIFLSLLYHPFFQKGVTSIAGCIVLAIGTVFFVSVLLSLYIIRNPLKKTSFLMNMNCRRLFHIAEADEKKFRSNNQLQQLREGELNAMIASYARHDELVEFLSVMAREDMIENIDNKIQELSNSKQEIQQTKTRLEKELSHIDLLRTEAKRLNLSTEDKLKHSLAKIDQLYGKSDAPDFSKREYLLPEDQSSLDAIERHLGLELSEIVDKTTAIQAHTIRIRHMKEALEQIQENIKGILVAIFYWYKDGKLPSLYNGKDANGRDRFNYILDSRICLINALDNMDDYPALIKHDRNPINFIYKNNSWISENAVVLIREIWQGFTKIAPPELINISIIDDTKRVCFLVGDSFTLADFNKYYQQGFNARYNNNSSEQMNNIVRGFYERDDVASINQELDTKLENIRLYNAKNPKKMKEALKMTGSKDNILLVNYCMSQDTMHNVLPYHIVILIVPEDSDNSYRTCDHDAMICMSRLIEQNISRKFGFIPVVIAPESNIHEKWIPLVEKTRKNGKTYYVDMKNLHITENSSAS